MKFSLIVAVVVLALAQGSLAQSTPELQRVTEYIEEMRTKLTEQFASGNRDLANHAETFQSQLHERMMALTTKFQEQVKPMATSIQEQIQPMLEEFQRQMQTVLQRVTEQATAVGN